MLGFRKLFIVALLAALSCQAMAMYDVKQGRFLQQDPLGVTPNPPKPNKFMPINQYADGMNLYSYVKSNSLAYLDPSGLMYSYTKTLERELWEDDIWFDDLLVSFYASFTIKCKRVSNCCTVPDFTHSDYWAINHTGSIVPPSMPAKVNSILILYQIDFLSPCKSEKTLLWAGSVSKKSSGYLTGLGMLISAAGGGAIDSEVPAMFEKSIGSWGAGFYYTRHFSCNKLGDLAVGPASVGFNVKDSGLSELEWR